MARKGKGNYFWGVAWLMGDELLYFTVNLLMLSFSD